MARVRIDLPQQLPFRTGIAVRVTDLNYGNHLGNHALLGLIHEARMQYFVSLGASELQFFGTALIMSDVAIEYKGEGFFGDVLTFEIGAAEFSRVGFELYYRVTKDAGQTTIALAKTGMICFDYASRKVVSVPDVARAALAESRG